MLRASCFFLFSFAIAQGLFAQPDVRDKLFVDTDAKKSQASQVEAALLAPKSYEAAMKHYRRAEGWLARGKSIERIRRELDEASADFSSAIEATEVAKISMAPAISARSDAQRAGAKEHAADLWNSAEEAFRTSAVKLESGSLKSSKKYTDRAEEIYREAELTAIKIHYLQETRALLAQAEELKAERYAPETYQSAQLLHDQAEEQLINNRYDTDEPRNLARQAKHQAHLAIYLSKTLALVAKKDMTMEALVLDWQTPVKQVGAALDIPVYFDDGYQNATANILHRLTEINSRLMDYDNDLISRDNHIAALENRVTELEQQLGGASEESLVLNLQLEREKRLRARFRQVEQIFGRDEAIVLRQGNDVILRLVGLTFPSGRAAINNTHISLLVKVEEAIKVFPDSTLVVEGHTDAYGNDEDNMDLSKRRAESTRDYLLRNIAVEKDRVLAVGFGESKPVANNETPEGRAKNRRIDVVIRPLI